MLFSNKNLEAKILLARLLVSEPKVEQKNMETLNVFFFGGGDPEISPKSWNMQYTSIQTWVRVIGAEESKKKNSKARCVCKIVNDQIIHPIFDVIVVHWITIRWPILVMEYPQKPLCELWTVSNTSQCSNQTFRL